MSNLMFSLLACLVGVFCGACLGALLMLRTNRQPKGLYDYVYCPGDIDLNNALDHINANGYHLISVTYQDGMHTVFFWRPTNG